jgi:hypothetical protein
MHDQDSSGRPKAPSSETARNLAAELEDAAASVLDLLLGEYPATLTYEEARLAQVRDPGDWGESDTFEIAVRELGRDGLIRRQGDQLVPVRPARQMADLGFSLG